MKAPIPGLYLPRPKGLGFPTFIHFRDALEVIAKGDDADQNAAKTIAQILDENPAGLLQSLDAYFAIAEELESVKGFFRALSR